MRAYELLTEASIFSRGTYSYGHKVKLARENKAGIVAIEKIQQEIPDYDPSEELEWVAEPQEDSPKIIIANSNNEKYFKRSNGQVFALVAGNTSLESILNHADKYNRGDIAEAILGAAISAKLIKRGSNKIGNIDINDIQAVLSKAVATSSGALIYTVEDKNSEISDKISFRLRLPSGSMDIIRNNEKWKSFGDLFSSALHYTNGSDADRYSNYFYLNGKVDEVLITSDGVSDQKGRKTDIDVVDRDPATDKGRSLMNIDLSLKADSSKYGQSTSGGLTKDYRDWYPKAKNVFEPFGITIDMPKAGLDDIEEFYRDVYKQASEKLDAALSGKNLDKETNFVEKVIDVIIKHGAGDKPNIRLVSFTKGTSSIHSFAILKSRLLKNNINLAARYKEGRSSGKPYLEIYDVNSGEVLTSIRYYQGLKASTNYFEKGPLLHRLTMVTKSEPKPVSSQPEPNVPNEANPQ
jgi:hypothetical protein